MEAETDILNGALSQGRDENGKNWNRDCFLSVAPTKTNEPPPRMSRSRSIRKQKNFCAREKSMFSSLDRVQSLMTFGFFVLAPLIWHESTNATSLHLRWDNNSQDATGVDIERREGADGKFLLLATVPANETSYTDTHLSNDTTYCYRVRAFNSLGGSPYSDEACGTTASSTSAATSSSTSSPPSTPTPTTHTISTDIADGAVLSGSAVIWTAVPSHVPSRVEFFINGTLGTTEFYSPYRFNGDSGTLDTTSLANGSHQLKVRALYADGSIAERTITVTVSNTSTPTTTRRTRERT
jgi:hypothetical protein